MRERIGPVASFKAALVADYADAIRNSRGFPVDPDDVMRNVSMIVDDNPFANAIDLLEDRHKGRSHIERLAGLLFDRVETRPGGNR